MRWILGAVALVAMTIASLPPASRLSEASGAFIESFDGSPAMPMPWHPSNWDVTTHSRDASTFTSLEPMAAGHGGDCSAPPATHTVSNYDDAVFICRDHMMTAINASGYGVIYLAPNQLVDFSNGEAVVRFDVSTLRTSLRDWIDVWITPFEDNVQLVGDIGAVDLNGSPRRGVQIRQDQVNSRTVYRGNVIRNFSGTQVGGDDSLAVESILTPSLTVRTTFELRLSRTHLKFGIPSLNAWWVDSTFPDLGWSSGVLQIGHHSYNPEKDCQPLPLVSTCVANTWHWDNISINPATAFTMLQPNKRRADQASPQLTFSGRAPAGSFLRFTGIGTALGVSFDGGASWQTPKLQAFEQQLGDEHFRSYWTPVPAGTQSVRLRGSDWFGGPWLARNVSIWANTSAPALATAPPTPTVPPPGSSGSPGPVAGVPPPVPGTSGSSAIPGLHSAWVGQTAYPSLSPGSTGLATLRFRNTGTQPWIVGVPGLQANLGVVGDSLRYAELGMTGGWLSENRLATSAESVVAPGDIGTFTFPVRAPSTPGTYRLDLALVIDGVTWLEDQGVYVLVTSGYGFESAWVAQSPWPVLRTGSLSDPISITFRNTGSRPWIRGAQSQQVVLGVVGDDKSWGSSGLAWPTADRVAIQSEDIVEPGQIGTFTFQLIAPAAAGTYVLPLRPVVDGVTWLDDQGVYVLITVVG